MAPSGLIVEGSNEQLHLLCVSQARLQIVREHYLLPGEAFRFLLIIPTSQSIQANEQYISSDTLTLSINVEPVTTQLDPTKDIQHNTNKKTWITPLQTTNVVGYNFQRCAIVKQVFIAEQEELTLVLETIIDCSINTECGEAILSVSIEGTQSQPEFDYSYYTNTASGQRTITNSTALMSNTDFLQVDSLLQNLQGITRQINSNAPIQIRRTLYMKLNCITPIAISVNPPVPITLHPSFIVSELDTSKIAPQQKRGVQQQISVQQVNGVNSSSFPTYLLNIAVSNRHFAVPIIIHEIVIDAPQHSSLIISSHNISLYNETNKQTKKNSLHSKDNANKINNEKINNDNECSDDDNDQYISLFPVILTPYSEHGFLFNIVTSLFNKNSTVSSQQQQQDKFNLPTKGHLIVSENDIHSAISKYQEHKLKQLPFSSNNSQQNNNTNLLNIDTSKLEQIEIVNNQLNELSYSQSQQSSFIDHSSNTDSDKDKININQSEDEDLQPDIFRYLRNNSAIKQQIENTTKTNQSEQISTPSIVRQQTPLNQKQFSSQQNYDPFSKEVMKKVQLSQFIPPRDQLVSPKPQQQPQLLNTSRTNTKFVNQKYDSDIYQQKQFQILQDDKGAKIYASNQIQKSSGPQIPLLIPKTFLDKKITDEKNALYFKSNCPIISLMTVPINITIRWSPLLNDVDTDPASLPIFSTKQSLDLTSNAGHSLYTNSNSDITQFSNSIIPNSQPQLLTHCNTSLQFYEPPPFSIAYSVPRVVKVCSIFEVVITITAHNTTQQEQLQSRLNASLILKILPPAFSDFKPLPQRGIFADFSLLESNVPKSTLQKYLLIVKQSPPFSYVKTDAQGIFSSEQNQGTVSTALKSYTPIQPGGDANTKENKQLISNSRSRPSSPSQQVTLNTQQVQQSQQLQSSKIQNTPIINEQLNQQDDIINQAQTLASYIKGSSFDVQLSEPQASGGESSIRDGYDEEIDLAYKNINYFGSGMVHQQRNDTLGPNQNKQIQQKNQFDNLSKSFNLPNDRKNQNLLSQSLKSYDQSYIRRQTEYNSSQVSNKSKSGSKDDSDSTFRAMSFSDSSQIGWNSLRISTNLKQRNAPQPPPPNQQQSSLYTVKQPNASFISLRSKHQSLYLGKGSTNQQVLQNQLMQHQESLINQKSPLQTSLSTSPQISFQSYQPPPLPPPPRPLLQKEKLDSLKQQINDQLSSNSSDVTGSSPTANDSLDCKFGVLSSSSSSGLLASNNPTSIQKNLDKKKIKLTASESKLASPHVDSKQSQVSSPLRNQSGSLNKLSSYTFRDDVPYSPAQLIYKENSFDLAVSTLSDIFQTSIHNQQHPVICLENEVIIGELAALRSTTVTLHFFITRPGIFELARIAIHDKLSQTVYEQPLFFPLSVLCIQQ